MKTLKLGNLHKFKISVMMHNNVNQRCYDYLSRRLTSNFNNYNYETQTYNLFVPPKYKLSKSLHNVLYFCMNLSNKLVYIYIYFRLSMYMYRNTIKDLFLISTETDQNIYCSNVDFFTRYVRLFCN